MRVLAYLHMYVPHHNAGAELMAHTLLRDLYRRGHEVRVVISRSPEAFYVYEGVSCSKATPSEVGTWFRWCDVALTHLDMTPSAMKAAARRSKPLVHLVHNHRQLKFHRVRSAALAVFNSAWVAEASGWTGRSIVIPPPVVPSEYRTRRGSSLTLVNLSPSKGAELFYDLAEKMPDRKFLGVRGSYGRQLVPATLPKNVTIVDNTPSMKSVYSKTRILLMPSDYESWGRVAIEAAASGIPTIAHPTPGLKESLQEAGIFRDRDHPAAWVGAINALDDKQLYAQHSEAAKARSKELDPRKDFERFETALAEVAG